MPWPLTPTRRVDQERTHDEDVAEARLADHGFTTFHEPPKFFAGQKSVAVASGKHLERAVGPVAGVEMEARTVSISDSTSAGGNTWWTPALTDHGPNPERSWRSLTAMARSWCQRSCQLASRVPRGGALLSPRPGTGNVPRSNCQATPISSFNLGMVALWLSPERLSLEVAIRDRRFPPILPTT